MLHRKAIATAVAFLLYYCSMKPLLVLLLFSLPFIAISQITDSSFTVTYAPFSIGIQKVSLGGKMLHVLRVLKDNEVVITDTVETNRKACAGFAIPRQQAFKQYFIFSKHQKGAGKTYILSQSGDWNVINGGTLWAATKHQLLFLLAERDLTNLVVYNIKDKKVLLEKFNCDEFDEWYYKHGNYLGAVVMECGTEPELEREVNEWMRPVEVEEYEPKTNKLSETHVTAHDLDKAKKLVRYCGCK